MVRFNLTPPTKSAAIKKVLELQASNNSFLPQGHEEMEEIYSYYNQGYKHGAMMSLIELFQITPDDFS